MNADAARQQVAELVERWNNTSKSERDSYNEDQTRHYFILPLFRALGWNTENPAEFSAEEQISRGFVDFGFYLNNIPVFYLETKRASEKLEKPDFMKQAINYAYLRGVTWAVLTDFEGLMVFNAQWETGDPVQARFLNLKAEHYANGSFDDLWLLSKSAMQARDMDRVAERYGKMARRQPVTDVLFKQLTAWRYELFSQMRQWSGKLWATNPREVDNAVQRLLDRLIFIRTVEDRGVEPPRLQALVRQSKRSDLFNNLLKLFRDLDNVYNSNLFAESAVDLMEIHDPDLIIDIVDGLYKVPGGLASYDFNAISADVLGAVYEQYLGFKAQDPEGKTTLDPHKQQKRKKQGIYYTPQFVVRYIVQQTLGKLLESGTDAHQLRILDPACGSGSFLIEAFDVLDRWLAQHGDEVDRNFPRRRRMRILQENLYGVDLDDQAVEVTRLNLMLRAVGEREKIPLLTHIQHGNSLISDPDIAGETAFDWAERFPEVMAGDTRPFWFVTFVTHNSRVSERMVTYGVESGEPLIFTPEEQILMAEAIAEACQKYAVPVVAWNVLPDHVHMVIAAENEPTLNELVRKIKGYSSYAFQRARNWEEGQHVWAQKFNKWAVQDEKALYEIIEYVNTNHHKHAERWGDVLTTVWESGVVLTGDGQSVMESVTENKGLKPLVQIVQAACWPVEKAGHVSGGFDVVIGNPPYVRQETLGTEFKGYTAEQYQTYAGTADLYVYFIERAFSLLHPGGSFGFIVPNKWMRANYGKALRVFLKERPLQEIVDFGDLPVFQDATTYPCIVVAGDSDSRLMDSGLKPTVYNKPTVSRDTFPVTQVKTLDFTDLHTYTAENHYLVNRESLGDNGWSLADTRTQALLDRLRAAGVPLGEYVHKGIYFGIKTGLNQAFIINRQTRDELIRKDARSAERIRPILMGRDVKRYETPTSERFLIFMPNGWTREQMDSGLKPTALSTEAAWDWLQATYPAIAAHLEPFAEAAARRWDKGEFWWELRSCDYYDAFEKPKIMYAEIATRGQFILDTSNLFSDTTVYIMGNASKYLLGILNSKLLTFTFSAISSEIRGGFFRWKYQYVEQLPIRAINFDDPNPTSQEENKGLKPLAQPGTSQATPPISTTAHDRFLHGRMVTLVEKMLALKQEHAAAEAVFSDKRHMLAEQIERTDREIDALVYDLYGLTDEEIRLVEGG